MRERLRRSMLVHLGAAFALGFLVLVGGMALFLESSMVRTVYAQIDKELVESARLTLHRLEEDHFQLDKELLDLGDNLYLRVMDPAGMVRLESHDMPRLAPRASFPLRGRDWNWDESPHGDRVRMKVVTVRCSQGWIQVARDMHPEEEVLAGFRRSLHWALALVPLFGALLGYGLVKLGLGPLRTVARGARQVGPENLAFRIDRAKLPLELDPLCQELDRTFHRLEEGFARLTALNGDLAHELRTPLHAMRLELERLLERADLPAEAGESLAELAESTAHMAALIEQMLFLARVEDPSRHIERQAIEPMRLLEQARVPFLALAEEHDVRIQVEVEGAPELHGDPTLLRRALHNLVANALRHSPPRGTIAVRARGGAHATVLEVVDQGPGVPAEVAARLGERFLRVEAARDKVSGGAGLGLAIVHGIAQLHGARLDLAPADPGGCRASITIPRT